MGVPKQRLWVSSGASTGENSQLYKNKLLIVKWRFWRWSRGRNPIPEWIYSHRVRNRVWAYILRGCIVRLRDVPGSRSSQRLCLCHCGATSPGPLKSPNVRGFTATFHCRAAALSFGAVGERLRRAGHAAPHSRAARGQASLGTGAGTRQKTAASRRTAAGAPRAA